MPRYTNNTNETIVPVGWRPVTPYETVETPEYLTDENGLTLTEHGYSGFCGNLLSAAAPGETITGLTHYKTIHILNTSGGRITIQPNNDSTNYWVVPDGGAMTITNEKPKNWYSMVISGSGTSDVCVWGIL